LYLERKVKAKHQEFDASKGVIYTSTYKIKLNHSSLIKILEKVKGVGKVMRQNKREREKTQK
jgi:hypothetical protein